MRDPRLCRRTIALLVDQELELWSSSTDVQDAPNCVGRPPIHNTGGRRGLGRRDQIQLSDRLYLGDMERGVHLKCRGKFQADGCRVHHLHYLKRTNEAWSQLPRLHPKWEVLRGHPDLLAWLIGRGWSPVPIGLPLRTLGGPQECSADLPPHPPTPTYIGLYQGHCHLVLRDKELV